MKNKTNIIIALAFAALLTGCGFRGSDTGTSQKVGVIVRVSKVGMISETWEAQLIRGGLTDGSGAIGTVPFDFTVESYALAQKTKEYMEAGTEVKITYHTEMIYSSFRSSSGGDFLIGIEPMAPKAK